MIYNGSWYRKGFVIGIFLWKGNLLLDLVCRAITTYSQAITNFRNYLNIKKEIQNKRKQNWKNKCTNEKLYQ